MDDTQKKLIVIKLGGSVIGSKDATVQDVISLRRQGYDVVLVHGGAKMVTEWLAEQGITAEFYQGERITDAKSLSVVTAVLAGLANKETTAAFVAAGAKACGISGVDGALIRGMVRDPKLGFIGDVMTVNPDVLKTLLGAGFIPVVSPVSLNSLGRREGDPLVLNINGDTVAGAIAAAMHAEQLIFLTDVEGIKDDKGITLSDINLSEVETLLGSGVAYGGMIPKLRACVTAAKSGVTCRIVDGRTPHAASDAVTGESIKGTKISPQGG